MDLHRPRGAVAQGDPGQRQPAAVSAAEIHSALANPLLKATGSRYESPVIPAAIGIAATAISCAERATALFTPDAIPAW